MEEQEKVFGPADFLRLFGKDQIKTTVILLYAAFALTLWKYLPSIPSASFSGVTFNVPSYSEAVARGLELEKEGGTVPITLFLAGELKIFAALVLMGLIPMGIVKWGFREKLSDYGLRFGNRFTLQSFLIFTPVMFFLAWFSCGSKFGLVYPFNPLAVHASGGLLVLHLVLYVLCYYLGWEFMFRGFMLKGLESRCGVLTAILIQTLAAAMLHYGHPLSETLGSIGGSVFWGCLVLRSKSILSGWAQHAALGAVLDFLVIHGTR